MCSKVDCRNCGLATWQGCGMHVRCALYGISEEDRCPNWRKGIYKPCIQDNSTTDAPRAASEKK
ncbi:hypothetical protein QTG54_013920 [Skeletonema marinoi]|uniref:Uncharacterized protein n=1 Tax=Skeletonema marinoi TaxID=267567 RepID=A0AAD8XWQ8_9STRA|nr:hypothetical protein QTG54_013920 [Skeletonema marinoi]